MSGQRGSEWRVIQRCLTLLWMLLRGPSTTNELLGLIQEHDSSVVTRGQLQRRMEADMRRLRENLGCEIIYNRHDRVYELQKLGYPLIDLPDDALRGLAFLQKTFSNATISHSVEVLRLVDLILRMLPEERATQVVRERGLLEVELRSRDSRPISEDVIEKITLACSTHNEIEFAYRSPQRETNQPRIHRVEPLRCYLDPVRRHHMLEAYLLETRGPNQPSVKRYSTYRLERMSDVRVLPRHFVPRQRKPPGVEIVYRLVPEIARLRDVTEHIADSVITYLPDDSAEIHAVSYNLFMDLRTLLHYGPGCEVIGGNQARHEMQRLIEGMSRLYGNG